MSATQPFTGTTASANSPENISNTGNSVAIPIVIAASVVSVALFLSLVFVIFYFVRRRRPRQDIFDMQESNYYYDKDDYLPPEPSPPPPPYKDTNDEPDVEVGIKPQLPPKDVGKPFVRMQRAVARWSFVSEAPSSRSDSLPVALPERALVRD